ncbi:MAG: TatD family hydrolase [Patescibacteria group bacterium]
MTLKLIDIHAHVNFPQFDEDRVAVIERARAAGVGMINVGTDLETSRGAVALAEGNGDMWATVGVHPTDPPEAGKLSQTLAQLEKLAQHPKVVAIGECGLDYFHVKDLTERVKQKELFVKQIELAQTAGKPFMIHCRNAYDELLNILKDFPRVFGNVHFFVGNWEVAQQFLNLNFTLSFTGVLTFTSDYDEVVKNTPLDRIMFETDCPFVAPVPYRGKRNEPAYVVEVAKQVAFLRQLPLEEVLAATLTNAKRVFAL